MVAQKEDVSAFSSGFVTALERAASIDIAMDVLEENVGKLGFPMIDYGFVRSPRLPAGRWKPPALKTRNFPRDWDAQWDRHQTNDPYYHASFHARTLIRWADVRDQMPLTPAELNSSKYLSDQGMHNGITIPIHMYDGSFAFISIMGKDSDDGWNDTVERHKLSLIYMAHFFNNTLRGKFGLDRPSEQSASLSAREAECLSWAARGKTSEEIGIILGLSVETVRVYTKRASCRLNATNRTHAVAKAVHLGLVEI